MEFQSFDLKPGLLRAVTDAGYTTPTPIQAAVIPLALAGDTDIVAQAQTGTGKTAAFVLPLLQQLDEGNPTIQSLILAPTRELANQVFTAVQLFSRHVGIRSTVIYGGTAYERQIRDLSELKPHVVVGTPGRLLDHIRAGRLDLSRVRVAVIDEADEMLKMGFLDDVQDILGLIQEGSTWMFSATVPPPILRLIQQNFHEPKIIKIAATSASSVDIAQTYVVVRRGDRSEALCRIMDSERDFYGIVFCRTKADVRDLVELLANRKYAVDQLHGDISQVQREAALNAFRSRRVRALVCTDVAARGIDVDDVTHVVNMGLPKEINSYVHRIGRTGRAGALGCAISVIEPSEIGQIQRIAYATKNTIEPAKVPEPTEIKRILVKNEIERLMPTVEVIQKKGAAFRVDAAFEQFSAALEALSREDVMKLLFDRLLTPQLRRLDDMRSLDIEAYPRRQHSGGDRGGSPHPAAQRRFERRGAGGGSPSRGRDDRPADGRRGGGDRPPIARGGSGGGGKWSSPPPGRGKSGDNRGTPGSWSSR